jgi:NaMN:DMB phosphoribosyltransferase
MLAGGTVAQAATMIAASASVRRRQRFMIFGKESKAQSQSE